MELKNKLVKAQSRLDLFVDKSQKAGKGSYLKYDYSRESDVLAVLKPLEKELGFGMVISQGQDFKLEPAGNMWIYSSMGTITIFDNESDDEIILNIAFIGQNNDPAKAYGSALTYGVKYAFKKVLQLPDDDIDPDNDQTTKKVEPKKEAPKEQSYSPLMLTILKEVNDGTKKGIELRDKIRIFTGKETPKHNDIIYGVQRDGKRMDELEKILKGEKD